MIIVDLSISLIRLVYMNEEESMHLLLGSRTYGKGRFRIFITIKKSFIFVN